VKEAQSQTLNSLFWIWTLLWSETGRRKTWVVAQPAKSSSYLSKIVVWMCKCRCGHGVLGLSEHHILLCNRHTGGAAVLSTLAIAFNWLASYVKEAQPFPSVEFLWCSSWLLSVTVHMELHFFGSHCLMFTAKQIDTGRMCCGILVSFYHCKCLLCNVCCPSEFVLVLGFSSVIF